MLDKQKILNVWHDNRKVAENYVFMTILQVLNVCFYLLVYPYLIRTIGAESYGLYAYAVALVAIFIALISFGFDLPAAKRVAENAEDKIALGRIIAEVTQAKAVLWCIAAGIYAVLLFVSPLMQAHRMLFGIAFAQTGANIFCPQWYFQGVQRMRVVTYVQVAFKVASLPFIFLLIRQPEDVAIYMLVVTVAMMAGSLTTWGIIRFKDGIRPCRQPMQQVWQSTKEAVPFFLSNAAGMLKEQGVVLLIGQLLGMADVAIYDLANKIIIIPRTIWCKLNDALYPKMMVERNPIYRRKVFMGEIIIGFATIAAVAALGYWAVLLLGGKTMLASYPVSIILSVTVLAWLVVGALIYFYIIPSGKTYWITINQVIALVSTFLIAGVGVYYTQSVYMLAAALAASGLIEIVFCTYVVRRRLKPCE